MGGFLFPLSKSFVARICVALGCLVVIVLIIYFRLYEYASIEFIQTQHERIVNYYENNQVLCLAIYFLLYIVLTGLSIPSATGLTLFGGAVFGLTTGSIVVALASSIGATIACVVARYLFRDFIQRKFVTRVARVNEGIKRDGAVYLFALRLTPFVPYFVVNVVMALTPLRIWTFYWITQLSMLPATVIYVNAGSELAQITSLTDIVSPSMMLALFLLGIFPLVAKKLVQYLRLQSSTNED